MQGREGNKMTQKQTSNAHLNGTAKMQRPDPEVVPKAQRRSFTASYKSWVLEEADKCRETPDRIGALLRREGLYSSHLTTWQRQREAGELAGLATAQQLPRPPHSPRVGPPETPQSSVNPDAPPGRLVYTKGHGQRHGGRRGGGDPPAAVLPWRRTSGARLQFCAPL